MTKKTSPAYRASKEETIYIDALRDTLKPVLGNIPHALLTRNGPDR